MKPADFKRWRKYMGYSQKDAAEALGLKRRVVQYYEKGERDGEKVKIPRSVRLACKALALGHEEYHGPSDDEFKARQAERESEAREKKKKAKDAATDEDKSKSSGKQKGSLTEAA